VADWPKKIGPLGDWDRKFYQGEWSVGVYPLRDLSYYEGRTFLGDVREYCHHAKPAGKDPDGDDLISLPRVLFAGHEWAEGSRCCTWLCLDCILERATDPTGGERGS
jgi:hypothetical protein